MAKPMNTVDGLKSTTSAEKLVDLCEEAGWTVRPKANGTGWVATTGRMTDNNIPERADIPRTMDDWRAAKNAVADCLRIGLADDLDDARAAKKQKARTATTAGRKAAERKAAAQATAAQATEQAATGHSGGPLTQRVGDLTNLAAALFTPQSVPAPAKAPANGQSHATPKELPLPTLTNQPTRATTPDDHRVPHPAGEVDMAHVLDPPRSTLEDLMVTKTVLVTPDLAADWLDLPAPLLSTGQPLIDRQLNAELVQRYRGMMDRGEWRLTDQGLAFAAGPPYNNGGRVNGQHRLWAVIEHGKPVKFRVTWAVDPNTFDKYDNGSRRTTAQNFRSAGISNSHHKASAARLLWCYLLWERAQLAFARGAASDNPYSQWLDWPRQVVSDEQLLGLMAEHQAFEEHCSPACSMMSKIRSGAQSGIPASAMVFRYLALRAWPQANADGLLDEFCHRVGDGQYIGKGDPPYAVRNWIIQKHGLVSTKGNEALDIRANAYRRETQLLGLIKAWNKYAVGDSMVFLLVYREDPMLFLHSPPPPRRRVAAK